MEYEEMLKKAYEKLPKKFETKKRFVVPTVVCEVSGNRTILRNFNDILIAIRRDAAHLSKYLSKELATAGSAQGNILVFQGKVSKEMLQKKIEDYIKEFVFCKECKEPDTKLIREDRTIILKCEACGAKTPVRLI